MSNSMNVVQHNLTAMFSNRQLGITTNVQKKSSEKLSSGYKINRAADDAAGLSISEKMRFQIRGLAQGTKNTQDGVSWCQIGDGAMHEIHDMLQRMNELAIKAANDTLQDNDRAYINSEVQQLKKEINRIGKDTNFNELPIFDNGSSTLAVDGTPDDIKIFDASYDDQTGDVAFGGVIFDGKRVPWSDIDSNMVTTDADGKQIFNAGDYNYSSADGRTFQFHCEDGAKVPDMTRTLSIEASAGGISVDGELVPWNKIYDMEGNPCTGSTIAEGGVYFDFHGAEVSIGIAQKDNSKSSAIEAINKMGDEKVRYIWETNYVGNSNEKAVDVLSPIKDIQISSDFAQRLIADSNVAMTVECDTTGIRLKDSSGNVIENSDTKWEELDGRGIESWTQGNYISDTVTYTFPPAGSGVDPDISISFKLSEVTSVDSVIDGLNGMTIDQNGIKTKYSTVGNYGGDSATFSAQYPNGGIHVNFEEEYQLGRNFDVKDGVSALKKDSEVTYTESDDGTVTAGIAFKDADGNDVIALTGDVTDVAGELGSAVKSYWSFAEKLMTSSVLNGYDIDPGSWSLETLIGEGNITPDGHMEDELTLTSQYKLTDGKGSYKPGVVGSTYASAKIDFSRVADLDQLLGLGFDSTCATCSNHYSVAFVDSTGSADSSGYDYRMKSMGNDHQLYIGIDALKEKGVTPGDLADALVDIASKCFDFHFQQYAAKDGVFYVYDDRTGSDLSYYKERAEFHTKPRYDVTAADFSVDLGNMDGDAVRLNYHADFSETKDQIKVMMEENNVDGEYIKTTNDAGHEIYKRYSGLSDSEKIAVDADVTNGTASRYDLSVKYAYMDENGDEQITTDRDLVIGKTAENLVKSYLSDTTVTIEALDYSYLSVKGDEKPNIAVRANYESNVRLEGEDNGIKILHSSNKDDITTIPRFPMNTVVMGIFSAKTDPRDAALKAIGQVKNALEYVTEKRGIYGAMQNRLEHTINNNRNKEENTQAAESLIRDTDMSEEMVRFSNTNILAQIGQSMLTQANQTPQGVLSLLS